MSHQKDQKSHQKEQIKEQKKMKIRHCNTEKENRFDCNLCGKPTLSIKSKDPCQNCIKVYPHHKKCHSCGRIYPDQTCFECETSCCKCCVKRRIKESLFLNCLNIRENGSLTPLDFPEKILCARPSYEKNICKILGPYFDCSSRY